MFNHYGVDADLGIQVDNADAVDREDLWRPNHAANEAQAAKAKAAVAPLGDSPAPARRWRPKPTARRPPAPSCVRGDHPLDS